MSIFAALPAATGMMGGASAGGGMGLMDMLGASGLGDKIGQRGGKLAHDAKWNWQQFYKDKEDEAMNRLPGLMSMMQGMKEPQRQRMDYGPIAQQQMNSYLMQLLGGG